ncbi:MAG: lipoate--protein ligase [Mariniphaga sp.]|nr:lipoate--protein ligase [Mariniphaga sp.]
MRCIISTSTDPYFNLATEEYLLKNNDEEIFLVYINEPCIVVGKHQNLLSEINLQYALEHNIKLARRISGGGTVYQDLNNLNFSFIHNCANLEKINFTKFTKPILEALREMGLDASFSGRNDLLVDSKKISGNAMHIFKTRVLSHGTLLFNTDLNKLSAALKNQPQNYTDKSIKSVRSKVTNISNYLESPKTIGAFKQILFQIITGKYQNPIIKQITNQETELIHEISKSKFETWEWIYGYSPKYVFQNSFSVGNLLISLEMQVEKGIIKRVITNIDIIQNPNYQQILDNLLNVKHEYNSILNLMKNDQEINTIQDINIRELCFSLF